MSNGPIRKASPIVRSSAGTIRGSRATSATFRPSTKSWPRSTRRHSNRLRPSTNASSAAPMRSSRIVGDFDPDAIRALGRRAVRRLVESDALRAGAEPLSPACAHRAHRRDARQGQRHVDGPAAVADQRPQRGSARAARRRQGSRRVDGIADSRSRARARGLELLDPVVARAVQLRGEHTAVPVCHLRPREPGTNPCRRRGGVRARAEGRVHCRRSRRCQARAAAGAPDRAGAGRRACRRPRAAGLPRPHVGIRRQDRSGHRGRDGRKGQRGAAQVRRPPPASRGPTPAISPEKQ